MHERVARQRLFLHIGLAKTGTTYLQSLLRHHRTPLRERGFCFPYVGPECMHRAAVEMASTPQRWGLTAQEVEGTFEALLDEGRRSGGTVVLSHEVFSRADAEQVGAIVDRLADFEVHVVLTVRDPGRSAVAHWQEVVKGGRAQSFADFLDVRFPRAALPPVPDDDAYTRLAKPEFTEKVRGRLDLWGRHVPPERLHVVIVPVSGAEPGLLWQRFAAALGVPDAVVDPRPPEGSRTNSSLGAPAVALLRRVNAALEGRMTQKEFVPVVKRWFAQDVLAGLPGERPALPAEYVPAMDWMGRRWIEDIHRSGAVTYGDPAELRVAAPHEVPRHPDEVPEAELAELGAEAIAELLLEVRRLRREVRRLRRSGTSRAPRGSEPGRSALLARVGRRLGIRGDARRARNQGKA